MNNCEFGESMRIGDPYLIQFNLLSNCINNCEYCYIKSSVPSSLELKRLKLFLKKFEEYYKTYNLKISVTLTGGDLFLYQDLKWIIEYLEKSKNVTSVSLLVNSLWHKNSKEIISKISNKIDNIQLNIDNIENREEDFKWLTNKGISISISLLLSKDFNYYTFQKKVLKKLIKKNPNLYISVNRLIPTKKEQLKDICSLRELQEKINELLILSKGKFISDDPIINHLLNKVEKFQKDSIYGCSIGKGSVTVYPDGSIKLCARIPDFNTGFTIENFELEKYLSFTKGLMEKKNKECNKCPEYRFCGGGCSASSFIKANKLSKDINCYYEK